MQPSLLDAYLNSPTACIVGEDGIAVDLNALQGASATVAEAIGRLPPTSLVGVATTSAARTLAAFEALRFVGGVPVLFPTCNVASSDTREWLGLTAILADGASCLDVAIQSCDPPTKPQDKLANDSAILFTSGTSSEAKPVVHSWSRLVSAVKRQTRFQNKNWLLAYHPRSFAGLQVILQSLLTGGAIHSYSHLSRVGDSLSRGRIDYASATPSYWRALLFEMDARPIESGPQQITLGGEIADQCLLDQLRAKFPNARIGHTYASTELGVCFSVRDGKAGLPAHWLNNPPGECTLQIADDGELMIRSPRRMLRYLDDDITNADWFPTGDLVEVVEDRIFFRGRKTDTMNIGGFKANPQAVEQVIRPLPGVIDVCVYGMESSVTGQVAVANVQIEREHNESQIRDDIMAACRASLSKPMVPARLVLTTESIRQGDKLVRANR